MLYLTNQFTDDKLRLEHVTEKFFEVFSNQYFDIAYPSIFKEFSNLIITSCHYRFLLQHISIKAYDEPFVTYEELSSILTKHKQYYLVIYRIGYDSRTQSKRLSYFVIDESVTNPKLLTLIRKEILTELEKNL